jgi:hypothetical protein
MSGFISRTRKTLHLSCTCKVCLQRGCCSEVVCGVISQERISQSLSRDEVDGGEMADTGGRMLPLAKS